MPFASSLSDFCLFTIRVILIVGVFFGRLILCQAPALIPINSSSLSGIIRNEDGVTLPGEVTVLAMRAKDGIVIPTVCCDAQTDLNGNYSCHSLPHGHYVIMARSSQIPKINDGSQGSKFPYLYSPTFYPNSKTIEEAFVVDLHDGENFSADLTLASSPAFEILGSLPGSANKAAIRVAFVLKGYPIDSGISAKFLNGYENFAVPLMTEGRFKISAEWKVGEIEYKGSVTQTYGTSSSRAVISASFPSKIDGIIKSDQLLIVKFPKLIAFDSANIGNIRHYTARIREDGTFTIPSVESGEYNVYFQSPGNMYIYAVSTQNKELINQIVTIANDGQGVFLNVEAKTNAASISGFVSQTGVVDDKIGIVVENTQSKHVIIAKVDLRHHFIVTGLAPGEYRLFAWSNIDEVPYRDADVLSRFSDQSETVYVDEGTSRTQVEVPLIKNFN